VLDRNEGIAPYTPLIPPCGMPSLLTEKGGWYL